VDSFASTLYIASAFGALEQAYWGCCAVVLFGLSCVFACSPLTRIALFALNFAPTSRGAFHHLPDSKIRRADGKCPLDATAIYMQSAQAYLGLCMAYVTTSEDGADSRCLESRKMAHRLDSRCTRAGAVLPSRSLPATTYVLLDWGKSPAAEVR